MEGDAQSISRLLDGEPETLKALEDWIIKAASAYRRRLADEWEDTLQDLHLEVIRLLREGRFRGESSLGTFIWRIVNNHCLNRLRNARRWQWTDLAAVDQEAAARLDTRLDGIEGLALRDLIVRVLEAVPEECRKLWSMLVAGSSYGEMAARLKVKEGTLRVRVRRCRMRAITRRDELLHRSEGEEW